MSCAYEIAVASARTDDQWLSYLEAWGETRVLAQEIRRRGEQIDALKTQVATLTAQVAMFDAFIDDGGHRAAFNAFQQRQQQQQHAPDAADMGL
jgi:hypothetical protein